MSSGVLIGLDAGAIWRDGGWYPTVVPGAWLEDDVEMWELGHTVSETVGPVATDALSEYTLRHPRDPMYPVLAYDTNGDLLRMVGLITVSTVMTIQAEGGNGVVYLPDLPPYQNLLATLTGATLTADSSTYNRLTYSSTYVGLTIQVTYRLGSAIAHSGLTAVTICGTTGTLNLVYRTDIPAGGVLPSTSYDLTGWLVTGTTSGTQVTQSSSQSASTLYSGTAPRHYLLCADLELSYGAVRIGATNQTSEVVDQPGRVTVAVPLYGKDLELYLRPVSPEASYGVRGVYLVESVDAQNRLCLPRLGYRCYLSTTPYATTASSIEVTVNEPLSWNLYGAQRAPYRIRVQVMGVDDDGEYVPYSGLVTVNNVGSTPCTLEDSSVPGTYWFSYDAGVDSRNLGFQTVGLGLYTISLQPANRLSVPHAGASPLCCFLDAEAYREVGVYTLRPRLRDQWGDTLVADSYAVTVHLIDGYLLGGTTLATQSVVSIANASLCTALGGKYAYLETTYQSELLTSPLVWLPPDDKLGSALSFNSSAVGWFIVDTDDVDGGAPYQA